VHDLAAGALGPAEQLPDRPAVLLAVQVPQRHLGRAHPDHRPAAPVAVEHAVVQTGPQRLRVYKLLADQPAAEERVGAVEHRPSHPGRDREQLGQAGHTLVGVQTQEGELGDPAAVAAGPGRVAEDDDLAARDLHGVPPPG
jgi:hypothetical protein